MVPCYMAVEFVNTNEWIYAYIPVVLIISVRREEITIPAWRKSPFWPGNRAHSGYSFALKAPKE